MQRGITFLMFGLLACISGGLAQSAPKGNDGRLLTVSLIQVIASPKEFDGQRLRIVGYLGNNGLDRAVGIFVSEIDGRNFVLSNSVDLHLADSVARNLRGKYVSFTGTYHAPAPRSGYNGYIDRIADIKPWNAGDAK